MPSFREGREKLPWPLKATTSVEDCASAIVDGFEKRKARVFVPKAAALTYWLRTLITSGAGERMAGADADERIPQMEREFAALGRSASRADGGDQRPGHGRRRGCGREGGAGALAVADVCAKGEDAGGRPPERRPLEIAGAERGDEVVEGVGGGARIAVEEQVGAGSRGGERDLAAVAPSLRRRGVERVGDADAVVAEPAAELAGGDLRVEGRRHVPECGVGGEAEHDQLAAGVREGGERLLVAPAASCAGGRSSARRSRC